MDLRYLHRLSRQIRPRPQDGPAGGPVTFEADEPVAATEVREIPQARPRRRRTGVCEVCGRTLLTGEVAAPLDVNGAIVSACPLCVIRAQTDARRSAA